MRDALIVALRSFGYDLIAWADVVMKEKWGRETAVGIDAVQQLRALGGLALEQVTQLSASAGAVEEYSVNKARALADTADEIAAKCPAGTLSDTIRTIASKLRETAKVD